MKVKKMVGALCAIISLTACTVGVLTLGTACDALKGEPGIQGEQGLQGVSIVDIEKTDSNGLVDTYRISFSDGSYTTFTVTNGEQGIQGVQGEQGIQGVQGIQGETGKRGATWTYGEGVPSLSGEQGDFYLDSTNSDVYVLLNSGWSKVCSLKGVQGEKGDDALHANEKHTVTYALDGGQLPDGVESSVTVSYGDVLDLPIPTRENYTFEGWYTGISVNDGKFTSVTPVTKTMTLIARWKANVSYRLTYETNGGNTIAATTHYFDEALTTLPEPVKYDCSFVGWYQDEGLTTPVGYPLTLTQNEMVYAKWTTAYYYVNFHTNCDSMIEAQNAPAGTSFTVFSAPENETFEFAGWYLDSGFTKPVEYPFELHANADLFAKWKEVYYTFSFVSNGGSQVSSQQYRAGVGIDSLPTPTRKDHRFDGWFEDFDLTVPVSFPYEITEAKTLYAKWTWVDPYTDYKKISSVSEFKNISNNLSGKYVLTKDIDFQNQELTPIGSGKAFSGVLDGNGYSISNITLTSANGDYGLFVFNNGTITNLTVESASISVTANVTTWLGIICTVNNGAISKVSVNGFISFHGTNINANEITFRAGLITATNNGQINNCVTQGNIAGSAGSGTLHVMTFGGVAGQSSGKIYDCFSSVTLSDYTQYTKKRYIGGIVGSASGEIKNCVFVGSVNAGVSVNVAIAGEKETTATETKCYAYTNVSGGTSVTISNLNSTSFYTSTLGWSEEIWDFSALDFQNGLYVRLK